MKYDKKALKVEVLKVFEGVCNLDNYEMVALTEHFEDLRQISEENSGEMADTARVMLCGALNFLAAAQHITDEQCESLTNLTYMVTG